MKRLIKLSQSALCAAYFFGGLAANAQNAATNVVTKGMSESSAARIACGGADFSYIEGINSVSVPAAARPEFFTAPVMFGIAAGGTLFLVAMALLPRAKRDAVLRPFTAPGRWILKGMQKTLSRRHRPDFSEAQIAAAREQLAANFSPDLSENEADAECLSR